MQTMPHNSPGTVNTFHNKHTL